MVMKKLFQKYLIAWLVALLAFNAIAFLVPSAVPGVSKYSGGFWVSWAFIIAAFVGNLICAYLALQAKNRERLFLNLPLITLTNAEMRFGYRTSIAKTRNLFFTEAVFVLQSGARAQIAEKRAELNRQRREKQPLEYRSAGSTFKRPEGHFAGKLIEEAGLKGASEGGAQVSEKHAGFIVNRGNASATDIITLMRRVRKEVLERSGVLLEPEVIILGETL